MLPPPTRTRSPRTPPHPPELNQALAQPNDTRNADDDRDHVRPAATPIRLVRRGGPERKEHACRHEQIPQDLGVRGQHIGKEDIAELPVLRLRDAADADAFQGRQEAVAACGGETLEGKNEEDGEEEEVRLGEDVPGDDGGSLALCDGPEEKDGGN